MKSSQKAGPPPCFFYALTSSLGSFERPHRTHISCSGRPHQTHISCSGRVVPASHQPPHPSVGTYVRASASDEQPSNTKTLISCSGRAPKPASHQTHILTVRTYVRASASNEQPSNTKTLISCSGRAPKPASHQPHILTVGTYVRASAPTNHPTVCVRGTRL